MRSSPRSWSTRRSATGNAAAIAMKILYGVVGEGMGHAMRSRVLLEHLVVTEQHEVEIMASGRAVDFLAKKFADANRIHARRLIYDETRMRLGKTLWSNVLGGAAGIPK